MVALKQVISSRYAYVFVANQAGQLRGRIRGLS
jgi:hypothetical protein